MSLVNYDEIEKIGIGFRSNREVCGADRIREGDHHVCGLKQAPVNRSATDRFDDGMNVPGHRSNPSEHILSLKPDSHLVS